MRRSHWSLCSPARPVGVRGRMARVGDGPLVLGIETSCDETGIGIVRGQHAAGRRGRQQRRRARPLRRRGARGRLAGPPRGDGAHARARRRDAGVRLDDVDAHRRHQRARASPARCWSAWPPPRHSPSALGKPLYGVNHLAAHVAVDQLEHGPLPEPCLALLVSGGHSSLLQVTDVTGGDRPDGRDDRRCSRRGVRQGRPAARPAVPGRPAHRPGRARGRRGVRRLPARAHRAARPGAAPLRLLVLRAQDRRRPLGRGARARPASRCPSPTWRRRSRRRCATCWSARRSTRRPRRASTTCSSAAGSRPTADCARWRGAGRRGGVRVRVPRPGPVHRQRRHGRRPRRRARQPRPHPLALDLPADSSQPVTQVLASHTGPFASDRCGDVVG